MSRPSVRGLRFRRAVAPVVLALLVAGCSFAAVPTPDPAGIAVPTQAPQPAGTARACPASFIEGRLVADPRWGIALVDNDGTTREVIWPYGYSARRDVAHVVLLDATGSIVAQTGNLVHVDGGETGADGAWLACGAIVLITPV